MPPLQRFQPGAILARTSKAFARRYVAAPRTSGDIAILALDVETDAEGLPRPALRKRGSRETARRNVVSAVSLPSFISKRLESLAT